MFLTKKPRPWIKVLLVMSSVASEEEEVGVEEEVGGGGGEDWGDVTLAILLGGW